MCIATVISVSLVIGMPHVHMATCMLGIFVGAFITVAVLFVRVHRRKCMQLGRRLYSPFSFADVTESGSVDNAHVQLVDVRRRPRCVRIAHVHAHSQVLVLYTNDSRAHRRCVHELCLWLVNSVRCDVLFDVWQFDDDYRACARAHTPPPVAGYCRQVHDDKDDAFAPAMSTLADWYMHAFAVADTYVVVCSAGTHTAFTGGRTRQHTGGRPDMFVPMCARVLQVCAAAHTFDASTI